MLIFFWQQGEAAVGEAADTHDPGYPIVYDEETYKRIDERRRKQKLKRRKIQKRKPLPILPPVKLTPEQIAKLSTMMIDKRTPSELKNALEKLKNIALELELSQVEQAQKSAEEQQKLTENLNGLVAKSQLQNELLRQVAKFIRDQEMQVQREIQQFEEEIEEVLFILALD